jgi:hypothetical protein
MNRSRLIEYATGISPKLSKSDGWKAYANRIIRNPDYGVDTLERVGILALGFEAGTRESDW